MAKRLDWQMGFGAFETDFVRVSDGTSTFFARTTDFDAAIADYSATAEYRAETKCWAYLVRGGEDVDSRAFVVCASKTEDLVLLETMPDHLRGSHRAARNWGSYPHNGAERSIVLRADAEEIVSEDGDGYARIVRAATPEDLEHYERA